MQKKKTFVQTDFLTKIWYTGVAAKPIIKWRFSEIPEKIESRMALSLGKGMSLIANGEVITQRLKEILISRITVNFLSP